MRVYSPTGEIYDGEPIDCRELVARGWSKEPPPPVVHVPQELGATGPAMVQPDVKLPKSDEPAAPPPLSKPTPQRK